MGLPVVPHHRVQKERLWTFYYSVLTTFSAIDRFIRISIIAMISNNSCLGLVRGSIFNPTEIFVTCKVQLWGMCACMKMYLSSSESSGLKTIMTYQWCRHSCVRQWVDPFSNYPSNKSMFKCFKNLSQIQEYNFVSLLEFFYSFFPNIFSLKINEDDFCQ